MLARASEVFDEGRGRRMAQETAEVDKEWLENCGSVFTEC